MINEVAPESCPVCRGGRLLLAEGEVCCGTCGAVLGRDLQPQEVPTLSKLNLYQAMEVGTRKVKLECARHMHDEKSETSQISNVCVKLDLPIYAAREANSIYLKMLKQKRKEKADFKKLSRLAAIAGDGETLVEAKARPRGCTKAHIAAFAVHLVCTRYGLPRSDRQILEAVRMNFGVTREFTILKAYSLNEVTAKDLGIESGHGKASYYLRLMLSRLQGEIGAGHLYDRISRRAFENLQRISDRREDARAQRAFDLAVRGTRLNVQI